MGSSNESKAAIVLVCLVILLGLILVCVFLRCCYRHIKKRQQNDREESQIKSHVIQMALFNATTTSMQPFVVIYITISIFSSVRPSVHPPVRHTSLFYHVHSKIPHRTTAIASMSQ